MPLKRPDREHRNYLPPRHLKCKRCGSYFETILPPIPQDGRHLERPGALCPKCVAQMQDLKKPKIKERR